MLLSRFSRDCNGSILPLFALFVIPLIGLAGAAIDYNRATTMRTAMQAGLDATVLMLSKEAAGLTTEQLQEKANAYFQTMFDRPEAKGLVITPTYTSQGGTSTIKLAVTGSVDTLFMRLLGNSTMDLGTSSEVTWGFKRLEVALALDNTGSMDKLDKMIELKKAAKSLVETLQKASKKDGDIKIAVIPFNTDVNVGTDKANATWIDWGDYGECSKKKHKTKAACIADLGLWTPEAPKNWNGCVADRDKDLLLLTLDYDVQDTSPDALLNKALFPAHQASPCPVPMLPLTSSWSTITSKIDAMVPDGNTNVTIGMVWGWHALTTGAVLTEASAPASDLDKVLILLTDGLNTENRWTGVGADIDERTKKACDNIKKDTVNNITVYTIRVIEGNAALLKGCASKPEYYYDVQNASQLNAVFKQISENLASLRISK